MKKDLIEVRLKELVGSSWKSLPDDAKEKLLREYKSIHNGQTSSIVGVINLIRQQRRDQGLMIMATVLGVLGGFFANAVDRIYAVRFGFFYNIIAIGCFILMTFFLNYFFNKETKDIIMSNDELLDMIVKKLQED